MIGLAELAARSGCKILAITDFEPSPLTNLATEIIYLPGMGDNFRVSISPVLVLAQQIVNQVAAAKGHQASVFQRRHSAYG